VAARRRIPRAVQALVRERAAGLCEYCHTAERWQYVPFTIDHVIPLAAGGSDGAGNLALACFHCNRRKGDRTITASETAIADDDATLFNPRRHRWHEHFAWSADGTLVVGVDDIGRHSLVVLAMNRPRAVAIRSADVAVGRHPPADDPVVDS
jgi:hypothetical protein